MNACFITYTSLICLLRDLLEEDFNAIVENINF